MGIGRKSKSLRETQSSNPNRSQFLLSTRNLVPVAKSVPTTRNGTAKAKKTKAKVVKSGEREEQIAVSLLKAPLVSTRGQEILQPELQVISDGTTSSRVDRKDSGLQGWQYLRYCRERLKMQDKDKTGLPFPYTIHSLKVRSGSSLLSMASLMTLPHIDIVSWDSVPDVSTSIIENRQELLNEKLVDSKDDEATLHASLSHGSINCEENEASSSTIQCEDESKPVLVVSPKRTTSSLRINVVENPSYPEQIVVDLNARLSEPEPPQPPEPFPLMIEKPSTPEPYRCNKKYSWQNMDRNAQTSWTLLETLKGAACGDEETEDVSLVYKYSWQIIGTETQTCSDDYEGKDAYNPSELRLPKVRGNESTIGSRQRSNETTRRNSKFCKILNSEYTQTCAHKENQTNFTDIYTEYRCAYPEIYG